MTAKCNKKKKKRYHRHGQFSICAAPSVFASSRELARKISVLRHTHGGETMLAPMTKIALPSCDIVFSFHFYLHFAAQWQM